MFLDRLATHLLAEGDSLFRMFRGQFIRLRDRQDPPAWRRFGESAESDVPAADAV